MTNPTNPVYIVSKGRHESMITSKSLSRMKVPHYIVIEPQDENDYKQALINFNLTNYVTLLIAPFSNHVMDLVEQEIGHGTIPFL